MEKPARRVAVIGSGVAGLSAAWLLSQPRRDGRDARGWAEVTLFDRAPGIGMDLHSLDICGARIDVPLRVFSEAYYPTLARLYKLIGVPTHSCDASFSMRVLGCARAFFRFSNWKVAPDVAIPVPSLWGLPALSWRTLRLCREIVWFFVFSARDLKNGTVPPELTFGDYLDREGYSADFFDLFMGPMFSVICTCSYASVRRYPAEVIIHYLAGRHGMCSSQRRINGGLKQVTDRLTAPVHRLKMGSAVVGVRQCDDERGGVLVRYVADGGGSEQGGSGRVVVEERFDHVVVATQANTALKLLENPAEEVRAALAAIPYETNRVLVHTDARASMPSSHVDWSPFNFVVKRGADAPQVDIWLNACDPYLRSHLTAPVFQSWGTLPELEPDPETVAVDATFERPVVTAASAAGIHAVQAIQRRPAAARNGRRVWFCGAYSLYAIPLLENGIHSAVQVVRAMGGDAHIPVDLDGGYESIDQHLLRCSSGTGNNRGPVGGSATTGTVVAVKTHAIRRRRRRALGVAVAVVLPLCFLGIRQALKR